jgi:transcriptional regulator with XRE-family HTH domain
MQTGRKILNLRCDRRISQQDLAKACEITPSALSKIEAGINSPRASVIWRIARNLGVTVEYLLDEGMPYPYDGYKYRQELFVKEEDPSSMVRMEVTREEKSYLEALRRTNQIARDIALAMPEVPVETLRLLHFLLHHTKIQNPTQAFLKTFESLLTTGNVSPTNSQPPRVAPVPVGEGRPDGGSTPARRPAYRGSAQPTSPGRKKRGRPPKVAAGARRRSKR